MDWTDWYSFDKDSIDRNASDDQGVYRIVLPDFNFFVLKIINNELIWKGIYKGGSYVLNKIINNSPVRVYEYQGKMCTDIVYIGRSESSISKRLLRHLTPTENRCMYLLMEYGISLWFSFIRHPDPVNFECKLFGKFFNKSGVCPPCDRGSIECNRVGGEYMSAKIMLTKNKRIKFNKL